MQSNEIHECETCAELGKRGIKANNQRDGVWCCVDCIVQLNREQIHKDTIAAEVRAEARRKQATAQPTELVRAPHRTLAPVGMVVPKSPIETTKELTETLSHVMKGLIDGSIAPDKALAACRVSAEWLKANELLWRMTKP